jgi:hypothetical protein
VRVMRDMYERFRPAVYVHHGYKRERTGHWCSITMHIKSYIVTLFQVTLASKEDTIAFMKEKKRAGMVLQSTARGTTYM